MKAEVLLLYARAHSSRFHRCICAELEANSCTGLGYDRCVFKRECYHGCAHTGRICECGSVVNLYLEVGAVRTLGTSWTWTSLGTRLNHDMIFWMQKGMDEKELYVVCVFLLRGFASRHLPSTPFPGWLSGCKQNQRKGEERKVPFGGLDVLIT